MMLAPGHRFATVEDAIAAEVAAIQAELVRVNGRIRALDWNAAVPGRRVAETWSELALGLPDDSRDNGDQAREVLVHKRSAPLLELERLRTRLTGQAGGTRRGRWG